MEVYAGRGMTAPILLGEDFHTDYEVGTLRDQPLDSRLILPDRPGYIPIPSEKAIKNLALSMTRMSPLEQSKETPGTEQGDPPVVVTRQRGTSEKRGARIL